MVRYEDTTVTTYNIHTELSLVKPLQYDQRTTYNYIHHAPTTSRERSSSSLFMPERVVTNLGVHGVQHPFTAAKSALCTKQDQQTHGNT